MSDSVDDIVLFAPTRKQKRSKDAGSKTDNARPNKKASVTALKDASSLQGEVVTGTSQQPPSQNVNNETNCSIT